MKIIFLNPINAFTRELEPNQGLLSLATFVSRRTNHRVSIVDANVLRMNTDEVLAALVDGAPDILAISGASLQMPQAYDLLDRLQMRGFTKKLSVIYGGPHASAQPEEVLGRGRGDVCIPMEGEGALLEVIERLELGRDLDDVRGIVFRRDGEICRTRPRDGLLPASMLDEFHPFDYSLGPSPGLYRTSIHVSDEPALPIMASRGCAHNCIFCASQGTWTRKVRFRSIQSVLNEVSFYSREYRIRAFHFYDDDLVMRRSFISALCESIIERGLQFSWVCLATCRAVVRNADVLPLLRRAGCVGIELGIESMDEHVLRNITRKENLEDIREAAGIALESGIKIMPLLMSFNIGEDLTSLENTRTRFLEIFGTRAEAIATDYFHINEGNTNRLSLPPGCAIAYPGTSFSRVAEAHGVRRTLVDGMNVSVFLPGSFLTDIPEKSAMATIGEAEVAELCGLLTQSRFSNLYGFLAHSYMGWDRGDETEQREHTIRQMVCELLDGIDGVSTVEQIAVRVSGRRQADLWGTRIVSCLVFGALAQNGFVRSARRERPKAGFLGDDKREREALSQYIA